MEDFTNQVVGMAGLATLRRRPALSGKIPRAIGIFPSILAPYHSLPLKNPTFVGLFVTNGGNGGARTRDLGLKRALLYQLSYIPRLYWWRDNIQKIIFVEFIFVFRVFFLCNTEKKAYILAKYLLCLVFSNSGDNTLPHFLYLYSSYHRQSELIFLVV
jgi:hypothetical protein